MAFTDNAGLFKANLGMSLDVLYHLVELKVFETHLKHLFSASEKYVIIYASDYDQKEEPMYQHENRRSFTGFIDRNLKNWKLKEFIRNKHPVSEFGDSGSFCDYYIYEKIA